MSVGSVSSVNRESLLPTTVATTQSEQKAQGTQSSGATTESSSASSGSGAASSGSSATSTAATDETAGLVTAQETESTEDSDELDAGKSTVKGDTDYFDGASVITDADTAIDIAKILDENQASNMSPEKMAGLLSEKGYNVEVVKVGNREAIKFENGDFFYDSDGDGNLGTKDQNFQSALSMVEQNYGVDLSELKNSKYTAYHEYSEIGKNKEIDIESGTVVGSFAAGEGRNLALEAMNSKSNAAAEGEGAVDAMGNEEGEETSTETNAQLDELDDQLQAAGYRGDKSAYDMWMDGELSGVLRQYGIEEPSLPETNDAMSDSMALFGAALCVAGARE